MVSEIEYRPWGGYQVLEEGEGYMTKGQQQLSEPAILQMDTRRAFDHGFKEIRAGSDIVRPVTGEALPFVIFRDLVNHITILYLEPVHTDSRPLD